MVQGPDQDLNLQNLVITSHVTVSINFTVVSCSVQICAVSTKHLGGTYSY